MGDFHTRHIDSADKSEPLPPARPGGRGTKRRADRASDDLGVRLEWLLHDAGAVVERARALQEDARDLRSLIAERRLERNHWRGRAGLPPIDRRRGRSREAAPTERSDMTSKAPSTRSVLEEAGIAFEPLAHARTETALAEARALGVAAATVAKTVLVKTPTGCLRAVLPATGRLDLAKVRHFVGLGKGDLRLLSEDELALEYPEFELGAVPPFGGAHADRVLVDRRLVGHEQVVLEAGTHEDSLRLASSDLVRVTRADVVDICQDE